MPILLTCPGCNAKLRIRDEYAGKAMKCPRCSAPVSAPAAEEPVLATLAEEPGAAPAEAARIACPECGKQVPATAARCRYCRAWLGEEAEDEELVLEEEEEEERPRGRYLPCPKCGTKKPAKVKWTAWGSYFGPKLFHHVRCRECGYGYNGKTGRSNLAPAIVFVALPLLLIIGILIALFLVLKNKGVF